MNVSYKITSQEREEINDHKKNTSKTLVKAYSLKQLSYIEGIDSKTIKKSGRYIPIRIDTSRNRYEYKKGTSKKPYTIKYIKLEDIKNMFTSRTGKKLSIE